MCPERMSIEDLSKCIIISGEHNIASAYLLGDNTMKVNLKCFSKLAVSGTCEFSDSTAYDLDDGHTVKDLVERAGIEHGDVKIAFVNNRVVGLDTPLAEGDRVGLAPAVGGM